MNKNIKIGVIGVITAAVLGYFYINQSADEPEKTVEVVEEVKTVQEKNVEEVQKETTVLNPIVIVEKRSFTAEESSALISALEKKNEEQKSDVEQEEQSGLPQLEATENDVEEQNVGVEQEGQSGLEEETINADGDIKEVITESVQEVQEDREHYHENAHHHHNEHHTEDVTNTSESVETPQEESKF